MYGHVPLVVDFRTVNLTIDRNGWPFQPTSKIFQKINPYLYWGPDFLQGYIQVPLHEKDRHLTAIILPWGKYTFNFLP